jgi:hypothetical protein
MNDLSPSQVPSRFRSARTLTRIRNSCRTSLVLRMKKAVRAKTMQYKCDSPQKSILRTKFKEVRAAGPAVCSTSKNAQRTAGVACLLNHCHYARGASVEFNLNEIFQVRRALDLDSCVALLPPLFGPSSSPAAAVGVLVGFDESASGHGPSSNPSYVLPRRRSAKLGLLMYHDCAFTADARSRSINIEIDGHGHGHGHGHDTPTCLCLRRLLDCAAG